MSVTMLIEMWVENVGCYGVSRGYGRFARECSGAKYGLYNVS